MYVSNDYDVDELGLRHKILVSSNNNNKSSNIPYI